MSHVGFCYGFEVMQIHESTNTPFSIMKMRFKMVCINQFFMLQDLFLAPKVVVYDSACNLHAYCLNINYRDPLFFKSTWFLVDRFHWPNHTGMHVLTSVVIINNCRLFNGLQPLNIPSV